MKLKTAVSYRNFIFAGLFCLVFSSARAYDPNKPWIYSMRFMMDTWGYLEMYSTATVVSKPSNFAAFRVVTSTTNPTYQVLVTTQGNVGISTGNPTQKLEVSGTIYSNSGGFKFPDGSVQTAAALSAPSSAQTGDLLYFDGTSWTRLPLGSNRQSLSVGYDSYTKLLVHMDGSDASTSFTDEVAAKTITANGNAQVDTAYSKFGTGSLMLDGSGDFLSVPDSADWSFGTGDFTIDFWFRPAALTGSTFWGTYIDDSNNAQLTLNTNGTIDMVFISGGTTRGYYHTSAGYSFTLGTWYHLAFERSGSTAYIFINGVSQTLSTYTAFGTITNLGTAMKIGSFHSDQYTNGWIDEFRVSKGIARWTSDFTPPSSPYASGLYWQ